MRSHLICAALWAATFMSGSPSTTARLGREHRTTMARNPWCSDTKRSRWGQRAGSHDEYPAGDAETHTSQICAKQFGAANPSTRKVPAARRLGWIFDLACRNRHEITNQCVCQKISTKHKGQENTLESNIVQAISVRKEVALTEIRSMDSSELSSFAGSLVSGDSFDAWW